MASEANSSEENGAVVQRVWNEIINEKNLNVVDEVIAPEFVLHAPAIEEHEINGRDGVRNLVAQFHTVFPNLHVNIEQQMVEDHDHVVSLWILEGDHTGRYEEEELETPIEPTGAHVKAWGTSVSRISEGMVAETWVTMASRTSGDGIEENWSVMSPEDWTERLGPDDGLVPGQEYLIKQRKPFWCRPFERCC